MIAAWGTFGRVLLWHTPALLAWYLGGQLVHEYWITFAGYIGGFNGVAGMLLMPVALMAQLVSFVAMFLVVRDALRNYRALVPAGQTPAARRQEFVDALLVAILPFTAFYAAQGFLSEDMIGYMSAAQDQAFWLQLDANALGLTFDEGGRGAEIGITPVTVGILVAAYALRWLWSRYDEKIPRWLTPLGVYLEAVWIYFGATTLFDILGIISGWVDTRVGAVWLADVGDWFAAYLAPVAVVWTVVTTLIAQVFAIMAKPLAWLAVAGTVYGQGLSAERIPVRTPGRRVRWVRARYRRTVPAGVRRRVTDLIAPFVGKFTPLWKAITMMFRAGPLLVAGYVFAYALWEYGAGWFAIGGLRAFGWQDQTTIWQLVTPVIVIVLAGIAECVRIAVTASAYDSILGRLHPVGGDGERDALGGEAVAEQEQVRAVGVVGDDERHESVEGHTELA